MREHGVYERKHVLSDTASYSGKATAGYYEWYGDWESSARGGRRCADRLNLALSMGCRKPPQDRSCDRPICPRTRGFYLVYA